MASSAPIAHETAPVLDGACSREFVKSIEVPARFLWFGDAALTAAIFLLAVSAVPLLQLLVLPGGALSRVLVTLGIPLSPGAGLPAIPETLGVGSVTALATLVAMDLLGGYRQLLEQSRTRVLLVAISSPAVGLGVTTVILFGLRQYGVSRLFLFTFVALQAVALATWRLTLHQYKTRRSLSGHYARGVLLIGTPAHLRLLGEHFRRHVPTAAYHVVGGLTLFSDEPLESDVPGAGASTAPMMMGSVDRLGDLLIHRPIDDVVVVQPAREGSWLGQVIHECDYFCSTLRIVPEAMLSADLRDLRADRSSDVLGLPALLLSPRRVDERALFLKRLIDVLASSALLILLAPLLLAVAMIIKLTTPALPILYRWRVVGYKGREFVGYKFTTMQADADARKADLDHLNEMQGPVFKIKNDPRTTALGRFLRKYSLNELPQLWSVLRGDMSLVGPRPAFPHELLRYEYWHKRKLSVKPGMTCLWQVRGRNDITNFDDWVRLDLKYIDNWSLWLDMKILIWTIGAIFRGTGS